MAACVVNKQFELLEFVFESVYVDLQYDEIDLTFTDGSVCLCGVCSPWSVCGVVVVPYVVGAVVVVTVMHVPLFVLHVCFAARLLGCEGDGNAGVGSGGGVVAVSAYMAFTCGSGVLASACGMLEMSVVRGVGGVCDMCMCLDRGVRCWG